MPTPTPPTEAPANEPLDSTLAWAFAAIAVPVLCCAWFLDLAPMLLATFVAVGVLFAAAAAAHAWRCVCARLRVRRELQRAAGEWPRLCRALAAASRSGLDLGPLLLQLGYHEVAVQRRLAHAARRWSERARRRQVAVEPAVPEVATASPAMLATPPRSVRIGLNEPSTLQNPGLRMLGGIALAALCSFVIVVVDTRLCAWFLFGVAAGIGLLVGGIEMEIRRVRQRREVERALREWDQLADAAKATQAAGGSLVQLLQSRGYRVYEVRQWLLRHLEG